MADRARYLQKAEQVELLSAALYRRMARLVPAGSNARQVLLKLAAEEDEHALRVRMLEIRLAGRGSVEEYDTSAFDRILEDGVALEALLAEGGALTAAEAMRFVVEQEQHFAGAHAQRLASGDPEVAALFAEMAERDEVHAALLRKLAGAVGGEPK
jgi:rubrerythrin